MQRRLSRLDNFLLMLPPKQLRNMVQLTNLRLITNKKRTTNTDEMLKMFGIMILITRYEFTYRASIWSTTAPYKYMADPSFGKTGMPRKRFDDLMRHLV